MNYFLDTCVAIGYIICTDPWNDKSYKLFNKNYTFHYSYCVNKELNKKINLILKEQKNFFYALRGELKKIKKKQITLSQLKIKSQIIPLKNDFDENKKEKIVELLWRMCKSKYSYENLKNDTCKIEDLLKILGVFQRGFERKILHRKNDFESQVILHPKRKNEYPKLYQKLKEVNIHYPDTHIILDAHDLSLDKKINIEFISADKKMINAANNLINLLNIDKFHYLKEF